MANILHIEKQADVIRCLVNGASVRATERTRPFTATRSSASCLMLRVAKGCEAIHDSHMRDLPCANIQVDEIWGYVAKKQRHVTIRDNVAEIGDIWTWVAIDAEDETRSVVQGREARCHVIAGNRLLVYQPKNDAVEEVGEPQGGCRAKLRLLQLRSHPQDAAREACDGGRRDAACVEHWRPRKRGYNGGMSAEVSVAALKEALENLHGCRATLREVARVVETFRGQTVWSGEVHIFGLEGHPRAKKAYAWSHAVEGSDRRRFVAVLHEGKIDSPLAAVRAAIVHENRQSNVDKR